MAAFKSIVWQDGAVVMLDQREVTHIGAVRVVPVGTPVKNPAFDVTPAKYITAIITEKGIINPPFEKNLAALMAAASSQN